jgi:hypothetical protein
MLPCQQQSQESLECKFLLLLSINDKAHLAKPNHSRQVIITPAKADKVNTYP